MNGIEEIIPDRQAKTNPSIARQAVYRQMNQWEWTFPPAETKLRTYARLHELNNQLTTIGHISHMIIKLASQFGHYHFSSSAFSVQLASSLDNQVFLLQLLTILDHKIINQICTALESHRPLIPSQIQTRVRS